MSFGNTAAYIAILVIAIIAGLTIEPPEPITKKHILRSLVEIGKPAEGAARETRVAVGTNVNVDLVVKGIDFFKAVKDIPEPSEESKPSEFINNKQELADTFAHFLARGAAAERFVAPRLFAELVATANAQSSAENKVGGNAALMAQALNGLGNNVLLGGPVGPKLKELLRFVQSSNSETDEVHIICEYSEGSSWHGIKAARSNRFILSPSISVDAAKKSLAEFGKSVTAFKPDVLVLSGLHLFEGLQQKQWLEYLHALKESEAIKYAQTANIPVHLELASLANNKLTEDIVEHSFPLAASIGLNEEELHSLFKSLGGNLEVLPSKCAKAANQGGHWLLRWRAFRIVSKLVKKLTGKDLKVALPPLLTSVHDTILNKTGKSLAIFKVEQNNADDSQQIKCLIGKAPNSEAVLSAINFVFDKLEAKDIAVSRLHFHCLSYHIVAVSQKSKWSAKRAAVAQGSKAVTLQACNATKAKDLHGNDLDLLISTKVPVGAGKTLDISRDNVVVDFSSEDRSFSLAPVLVCKNPVRTVGLGDLTSASALSRHF